MRFFHKLVALRKSLGFYNGLLYLTDRAADALRTPLRVHRYYFVSQPVHEPRLPDRWRRGLDVKIYTSLAPELSALPLSESVLIYRFEQNSLCFCATRAGTVVGCVWLCLGDYLEDEVDAVYRPLPPEATVWDFDVYVSPDHRGALIFPCLWDAANAWLRERGVRWSVSRISAYNVSSLAAHQRLGARVVGSATFVRIGRLQLCCSDLGPRAHLGVGRGHAPVIRVPAASTNDASPAAREDVA